MKAHLDCIVCQQRQALRILQLATEDQHLHESVLRQVMDYLLHTEWTADPMTISRGMYEIINRATKNPDPYKEIK